MRKILLLLLLSLCIAATVWGQTYLFSPRGGGGGPSPDTYTFTTIVIEAAAGRPAVTLAPGSYDEIRYVNQDADGADITLSEAGAINAQRVTIVALTYPVTIKHAAGSADLGGRDLDILPNKYAKFEYVVDTWIGGSKLLRGELGLATAGDTGKTVAPLDPATGKLYGVDMPADMVSCSIVTGDTPDTNDCTLGASSQGQRLCWADSTPNPMQPFVCNDSAQPIAESSFNQAYTDTQTGATSCSAATLGQNAIKLSSDAGGTMAISLSCGATVDEYDIAFDNFVAGADVNPGTTEGRCVADSTQSQLDCYINGAERVFESVRWLSAKIEDFTDLDNYEFYSPYHDITVIAFGCRYQGTGTAVGTFALENDAGTAMTHTAPTCVKDANAATFQAVSGTNTIAAGRGLRFDTGTVPNPATDDYILMVAYTIDKK